MATHSSVLSLRVPGTEEPGGLLSVGSHRVGHDWSDLAAAAAVMILFSNGLSSKDFGVGKKCLLLLLVLKEFCFLISILQIKVRPSQFLISWTAVPLIQVHQPLQLVVAYLVVPPHPPAHLWLPLCLDRPAIPWAALPLETLPNLVHLSLCCFLKRANQQPHQARVQLSPHLSLVQEPAVIILQPLASTLELQLHLALQVCFKKTNTCCSWIGFHSK